MSTHSESVMPAARGAAVLALLLVTAGAVTAQVRRVPGAPAPRPRPTVDAPLTAGEPGSASSARGITPRAGRTSDEVIARDLAFLDGQAVAAGRGGDLRRAGYTVLARDAYERNDAGDVTALMLGAAEGTATVPREKRMDLWALVDTAHAPATRAQYDQGRAASLEMALVRAQYPILGAPTCAAWEAEAVRIAADLRRTIAPAPVVAAQPAPVPTPVPAPAPAPVVTPPAPVELHGIPSMVHFALDKHDLSVRSRAVLDILVDSLQRFPDTKIVLEGHTDLRASVAYNIALSRRRTMSVRAYLIGKGIAADRLTIVAQGKSQLEETGTGVVDHAKNRRVQLRYFLPDGREIEAKELLDDLQLEGAVPRATRPRRR